jgi:hypothetical protein
MAAVAAMGAAGAANAANYFVINGAEYNTGSGGNVVLNNGGISSGSGIMNVGGFASVGLANMTNLTGVASTSYAMDSGDIAAIRGVLGDGTLATTLGVGGNSIYYFGFHHGGQGFFGVYFRGSSAFNLTMSGGADRATLGVHNSIGQTGTDFVNGGWISAVGYTSGNFDASTDDQMIIFAGIDIDTAVFTGSTSDGAFDVRYLNWNGSSFTNLGGVNNVESSVLGSALYQIPVPAPMLLAGAGLIGAAALRRRMVKKA